MPKFLTPEWIAEYAHYWNQNETLINSLKNFNARIKYYIEGGDQPPVYIHVEGGEVKNCGIANGGKYDFEMWATPDDWKTIVSGEMGPKAAMLTKKLKFKGSMITAMKYMGPFQESLILMGKVPTEW